MPDATRVPFRPPARRLPGALVAPLAALLPAVLPAAARAQEGGRTAAQAAGVVARSGYALSVAPSGACAIPDAGDRVPLERRRGQPRDVWVLTTDAAEGRSWWVERRTFGVGIACLGVVRGVTAGDDVTARAPARAPARPAARAADRWLALHRRPDGTVHLVRPAEAPRGDTLFAARDAALRAVWRAARRPDERR